MKKLKALFFLFLLLSIADAQTNSLSTKVVEGKAVRVYKIVPGDGWFSIAQKFNISYAELKLANKNTTELKIGESLVIPGKLKSNDPYFEKNYTDKNAGVSSNSAKDVTHKVAASETLFSISKKYNVSVDQIKRLNSLKSNSILKGQVLVISKNNTPIKEEDGPKKAAVVKSAPAEEVKIAVKETKKEADEPVKTESSVIKSKESVNTAEKKIVFANGRQEVNETGIATWIENESTSTNKYYALHRTAPIGTIIKITNRMNQRSIYVKVVGKLPDTGDNEGLIIKVSKTGAEKLGVIDPRFQASLVYGMNASK